MPQLNPSPWLTVMLITWLFLLVVVTKTLNSHHTAPPKMQNFNAPKAAWTWMWH
uniref:ATP synthase complex subunit 8 n=1 Tax=Acanthosaura lepidogaster TaxID=118088 RepID=A0A0U2H5L8_9SAUR|nr:ATP synthase F0 subunit 8 [Acanthosaura lepidogaster]